MPETAALHIQARDSDPVRVVDLTGVSIRIGRAAFCDLRLHDPDLADEECRLRRRGGVWQLHPSPQAARAGSVWLGDHALKGPCTLAYGMSFRVGSYHLTLEPAEPAPSWDVAHERPPTAAGPDLGPSLSEGSPPVVAAPAELTGRLRDEWQSRSAGEDRWAHSLDETRKWESRFRAAGAKLRSETGRAATAPRPGTPRTPTRPVTPPRVDPPATPTRPATAPRSYARPSLQPTGPAFLSERPDITPPPMPSASPIHARTRSDEYRPATPRRVARTVVDHPAPAPAWSHVSRPPLPEARSTRAADAAPEPVVAPEVLEALRPVAPEIRREPEPGNAVTLLTAFDDDEGYDFDAVDVGFVKHEPEKQPGPATAVPVAESESESESESVADTGEFRSTGGLVLGAARRVSAPAPDPAATPESQPVAAAGEEPVKVAARGWLPWRWFRAKERPVPPAPAPAPAPEPPAAAEAPATPIAKPAPDVIEPPAPAPVAAPSPAPVAPEPPLRTSAAWEYQTPIVTDTNLGEAPSWPGRAAIITATEPVGSPELGRAHGGEAKIDAGPGDFEPGLRLAVEEPGPARPRGNTVLGGPPPSARDWPTVSDILAAHGRSRPTASRASTTAPDRPRRKPGKAKGENRPTLTDPREPSAWSLPLWLAWLPATCLALAVGLAGCVAGWLWSRDAYNAGIVAARLAAPGAKIPPLPEGVEPGRASWWATTSSHLVQWAAYLDQTATEPAQTEQSRALLEASVAASPLQASARYARAHGLPGEASPPPLARLLGQSRDVVSLTWSGHRLLADGKKEAALRAYAAALEMAAHTDPARSGSPTFIDDPQTRRYTLPTEAVIAPVVRDMLEATTLTYKDWAGIVPRGTTVPVVVARILKERLNPDAEAALEAALAESEHATTTDPLVVAAHAEAFALKGRWSEALDRYRQAIDLVPIDVIRRSWWMNVADIASRLDDQLTRRTALDLAKCDDTRDEITQRAVDLQKSSGLAAGPQRDNAVRPARTSGGSL